MFTSSKITEEYYTHLCGKCTHIDTSIWSRDSQEQSQLILSSREYAKYSLSYDTDICTPAYFRRARKGYKTFFFFFFLWDEKFINNWFRKFWLTSVFIMFITLSKIFVYEQFNVMFTNNSEFSCFHVNVLWFTFFFFPPPIAEKWSWALPDSRTNHVWGKEYSQQQYYQLSRKFLRIFWVVEVSLLEKIDEFLTSPTLNMTSLAIC